VDEATVNKLVTETLAAEVSNTRAVVTSDGSEELPPGPSPSVVVLSENSAELVVLLIMVVRVIEVVEVGDAVDVNEVHDEVHDVHAAEECGGDD